MESLRDVAVLLRHAADLLERISQAQFQVATCGRLGRGNCLQCTAGSDLDPARLGKPTPLPREAPSESGAPPFPLPRLAYTRREAAEVCGVSEDTIRRAKNAGALRAKRLTSNPARSGGKELYTPAALQGWLEGLHDA